MAYDRKADIREKTAELQSLLQKITHDEREIRLIQQRLYDNLNRFRDTMSARDALERHADAE